MTVITEQHDAPSAHLVPQIAHLIAQQAFHGVVAGGHDRYGHAVFLCWPVNDETLSLIECLVTAYAEDRPCDPPTLSVVTTVYWRGDSPGAATIAALHSIGFPWHKHGIDVTKITASDLIKSIAKL